MRKYLYGLMLVLLLFTRAQAGEGYLTGGLNVSRFYDVGSKPLLGFSLGYGQEWSISEPLALTFGLSYFYRGARVENKIIYHPSWLHIVNMNCRVGYIEIPFSFRWYFVRGIDRRYYFSCALCASLAICDGTDIERIKSEENPKEFPRDKAHYYPNEDPDFTTILDSSAFDIIVSSGIKWNKFSIEGQARYNFYGDVDTLARTAGINSKFFTMQILVSWYFS